MLAPFPSEDANPGSGGGGATPIPAPIAAPIVSVTPKIVPFLVLHRKKLVAGRRGIVKLAVTCPAGGAACAQKLALTTTVRVHSVTAATAKKKVRTVKLGAAQVLVAPGATAKVRVKLTKTGRALLRKARRHRLKATLTLTAGERKRRRAVTLALARAK